jgi:hypothetical protein
MLRSLVVSAALVSASAFGSAPGIISHQGRVTVSGNAFTGTGLFKFALVDGGSPAITYWSNNGSSAAGSEPTAAVSLTVTRGIFSVNLGDTGMDTILASVFANDGAVYLRTWFSDGSGFQRLSPDVRMTSVGYALNAASAAAYTETDPVYAAAQAGFLKTDGSRALTASLNLGGNHLLDLPAPASITADNEAASKAYVDSKISGLTWQASVTDILNDPPGSPASGVRYIVGTAPTGQWATDAAADKIAQWTGSAWSYTPPSTSMAAFVTAKSNGYVYSGAWVQFSGSTYTFGAGLSYAAPNVSVASAGITAAMLNQMSASSGQVLGWNGSAWAPATPTAGTVTSVSATGPLASTGGATPNLTLQTASAAQAGALSSTDWSTFNGKVGGSGTASYVPKFTAGGTVGNSALYSDASGNIGIGTTTPTSHLEVRSPLITTPTQLGLYNDYVGKNTSGGDYEISTIKLGTSLYHASISTKISNGSYGDQTRLDFSTPAAMNDNTQVIRMSIMPQTGNVGIGTTSPDTRLDLGGGILSAGALNSGTEIRLRTGIANNASGGVGITPVNNENTNADGMGIFGHDGISLWTAQTEKMRISSTGNVGIGTTTPSYTLHVNGSVAGASAYVNTSDARLKKDVQPIGDALAIVEALRGVTFNWDQTVDPALKLDDRNHVGFLAQEVEKVLPQAVSTATDARQTKSVAYSEVIPVLTEAIKQLKAENDALKARLDALEAKLGQ